jgi:hypothetical protein
MYTHCRQFPHLQGRSDDEIRAIVRRALDERPAYRKAMRVRNFLVLAILASVVLAFQDGPKKRFGYAMMYTGMATTAFVLTWNVVWVNVVLYRLTNPNAEK